MSWEIRISGDPLDLRMLENACNGLNLTIIKHGDEYLLSSTEFEALNESEKIREKALEFLEFINGAAKLLLDSRNPIEMDALYRRHADGRRDTYIFTEPAEVHFRGIAPSITVSRLDGSTETYHPADPIPKWIGLASKDEAVASALRLLSCGALDWVNLYRIFEVIMTDCQGLNGIVSKGWATKKALTLFKHTANSPTAIGTESRHGTENNKPPPKPMTLSEAKSLIIGIVQPWLHEKLANSDFDQQT